MDLYVKMYANVCYDPSNPSSFGAVNHLWREVGGSCDVMEDWLKSQDTYTFVRKKILKNRIQVAGIDDQWQGDLVDVNGLAKYNNNFKFLLTVID